jgi:hypothetical protein
MSARFRARAPGPVSGQLCSAPGGRAGRDGTGFLLPFGRRHLLLGHPVPPRASAPLTIGLPRRKGSADPSGVSMFRTREMRPGPGALCTPGTAVPARPRMHPVTAACRLATAGPCHPGTTARPGMFFSRGISKGSLAFAPPGLPLACGPRTERGLLGFTPGFTPGWAGPSRACRGGDGPQALARGNVAAIISGLLPRRTHSLRATSRRNAW